MKVESLALRNFRVIQDCVYYPDRHLNFLIGSNGQGKTTILEALGFFGTLRSFRGSRSAEVIRTGTRAAELSCVLSDFESENSDWKTHLSLSFSMADPEGSKANKTAQINGKAYPSSIQYLHQRFGSAELGFHAVVFNPSDHDLARGDPSTRRAYLDRALVAEDVEYLKIFKKYRRVLEQRNSILRSGQMAHSVLKEFNEVLVSEGALLTFKRLKWIQTLSLELNHAWRQITPVSDALRLIYLSNWVPQFPDFSFKNNNLITIYFTGQYDIPSLKTLEQVLWNNLAERESAEWKAGCSLVGPHRDDWTFVLGHDVLRGRGSQGEVRSALLALKLSELALFRKATGHRPVFLLDDFSSELDRERRNFLLSFLSETDLQVFVTSTEENEFPGKRTWVFKGSLSMERVL